MGDPLPDASGTIDADEGTVLCEPWASPGARIRIGAHTKATVRYVGHVEGQKGHWIGIEWDDMTRGKHDGCYKGKRYFTCRKTGSVASFVRYEALRGEVYPGVSLKDAITAKYKVPMGSLSDQNAVVGAEDVEGIIQRDGALEVAGLEKMDISSCFACAPVMAFLSNIKSLDLSENLLSSWSDVAHCISSLQNLRVVNLSRNIMQCDDGRNILMVDGLCGHIKTLVLNGCSIQTSDTIRWIARIFPNVTALYLFENQIPLDGWNEEGFPFPSLETLDIGCNGIKSWNSVAGLVGNLPTLQYLSLEGNEIEYVSHGTNVDGTGKEQFEHLRHLNLGENSLKDWDAIQDICTMRNVSELRFSGNPLCSNDTSRDRLVAIGRLASLSWINGSDVSACERRDSELAFLRRLEQYVDDLNNISPLLELRIQELERHYSTARISSGQSVSSASLGSKMVHIRLVHGTRIVSKKVPPSITIDKLKRIVQKLLGIKAENQSLTLQRDGISSGVSSGILSEVISQDGSKDLSFFGMECGSYDIVIEESCNHLDTERTIKKKSHDAKIEHQEHEARVLAGEHQRLMQFR